MVKITKIVKQVTDSVKQSKKKITKKKKIKTKNILSSGSTLLNLACTNNPFGAFTKGKYYYLVGDSASGKTFLSMTCFAEALQNPEFKDYRLIYDNVEDGMNIDLENLFNKEVAEKVEPPGDEPSFSIEEFYYHLDDAIKKGKPFIYVLDSMDGLSSEAEVSKFEEHKNAHRKGKIAPGSYGDGKAKKNSEGLRKMQRGLRETESILIIISQTRDNLGFGFKKKTRSGGHALKFYATIEIWSNIVGSIKKIIKDKKRQIGVNINLKTEKNRITGELYEVKMDIYPSYGIDDIGSMVDYLVSEGWWKKKGQKISAKEFKIVYTKEKIIKHIEKHEQQYELQKITGRCWNEIREACNMERKGRYK